METAPMPPPKYLEFAVTTDVDTGRLDRWVKRHFPHLGYNTIQKFLRAGDIRVNGQKERPACILKISDTLQVFTGLAEKPTHKPIHQVPSQKTYQEAQALKDWVLHHDEAIIVLNKPPGLATQGGPGIFSHVDLLLKLFLEKTPQQHPHLVHRLDRETSGVLVVALNRVSAAHLSRAFQARTIEKVYEALVAGVPLESTHGIIQWALRKGERRKMEVVSPQAQGALEAVTHFSTIKSIALKKGESCTWLHLVPHTGRTHQLRAHCAAMGWPIVGDGAYGGQKAFPFGRVRLHLHAAQLTLQHPVTHQTMVFRAPRPRHMEKSWALLETHP